MSVGALDYESTPSFCTNLSGTKRCAVLTIIVNWLFIVFFDIGDRNRREELRIFLLVLFRRWI